MFLVLHLMEFIFLNSYDLLEHLPIFQFQGISEPIFYGDLV